VGPGALARAEKVLADGREQDVVDEGGLAGPRDAGDADQASERERRIDLAEVVLAGAADADGVFSLTGRRFAGTSMRRRCER
jgi:hypothetical protein